jgi:hypothetical protein
MLESPSVPYRRAASEEGVGSMDLVGYDHQRYLFDTSLYAEDFKPHLRETGVSSPLRETVANCVKVCSEQNFFFRRTILPNSAHCNYLLSPCQAPWSRPTDLNLCCHLNLLGYQDKSCGTVFQLSLCVRIHVLSVVLSVLFPITGQSSHCLFIRVKVAVLVIILQ